MQQGGGGGGGRRERGGKGTHLSIVTTSEYLPLVIQAHGTLSNTKGGSMGRGVVCVHSLRMYQLSILIPWLKKTRQTVSISLLPIDSKLLPLSEVKA